MSKHPQPLQHPLQLARLPLAKFSHTTTSLGHKGPFNWCHIIGNGDLFGVFEKFPAPSSTPNSLLLRINNDHEVLEEIDFAFFLREAIGPPPADSNSQLKPSFAVVVKLPCLAVKYPNDNGWIRRFQMKFSIDRDYYTALSVLSDIKCPFSESNLGTMPLSRKATPSYWNSGTVSSGHGATYHPPASNTTISTMTAGRIIPSSSGTSYTSIDTDATSINNGDPFAADIRPSQDMIKSIITGLNQPLPGKLQDRPFPAIGCDDMQTLDHVLPPRRVLPFRRPKAKRSYTSIEQQPSFSQSAYEPRTSSLTGKRRRGLFVNPPYVPYQPGLHTRADMNRRLHTSIPNSLPNHVVQPYQTGQPTQNSKVVKLKFPPSVLPKVNADKAPIPVGYQIPRSHPYTQPTAMRSQPFKGTLTENQRAVADGMDTGLEISQGTQLLQPPRVTDLSSYTSAPTTERLAQLEAWICRNVEDDGFLQLCHDIEAVWQRIALGK